MDDAILWLSVALALSALVVGGIVRRERRTELKRAVALSGRLTVRTTELQHRFLGDSWNLSRVMDRTRRAEPGLLEALARIEPVLRGQLSLVDLAFATRQHDRRGGVAALFPFDGADTVTVVRVASLFAWIETRSGALLTQEEIHDEALVRGLTRAQAARVLEILREELEIAGR